MGFSLCSILTPGAIHALMAYGTEEQRQTWLPKLVTGEWNGTMNLTEPAAGSDVGALRSTAEKVAEGPNDGLYRITGQKILSTVDEDALTANIIPPAPARTPYTTERPRSIAVCLVHITPLDTKGRTTTPNEIRI